MSGVEPGAQLLPEPAGLPPAAAVTTGVRGDLRALRPVLAMLGLRRAVLARAVALGSLTLAASVALSGTAAWLIVRAAQMPPVMYLNVAAVGVRTFGILRGVSRYLERLATHDAALAGVAELRTQLYERLSAGRTEELARLRRGDLLARTGADVDDVGDVVIRALVPAGVSVVVGLGSVVLIACFSVPSALVLLACLAVTAVVVPALAGRADSRAETVRVAARAEVATATEALVSRAAELAVGGGRPDALAALEAAHTQARDGERLAARPLAWSAATAVLAVGASVLGALLVAVPAVGSGALTATELAVVVLVPLAAFEATAPLPAAAAQLRRSAQAARRISALLAATDSAARPGVVRDSVAPDGVAPDAAPEALDPLATTLQPPGLHARGLVCGWPGGEACTAPLDLDLTGGSLAVVGPSGTGKTTLLLTLAGMLAPVGGAVRVDGVDPHGMRGPERAAHVALTAEDAHVFGTSVLENIRVARGDVAREEALELLDAVGLRAWVEALPDGLDTVVGPETISGGERRRLLVARALASPAPLLLLDEPAEHLPDDVAQALVRDLLALGRHGRSVVVVTHHVAAVEAADAVVTLGHAVPAGAAATGAAPGAASAAPAPAASEA